MTAVARRRRRLRMATPTEFDDSMSVRPPMRRMNNTNRDIAQNTRTHTGRSLRTIVLRNRRAGAVVESMAESAR
jgi:hypothetical protein